jgi:hypothetical protein
MRSKAKFSTWTALVSIAYRSQSTSNFFFMEFTISASVSPSTATTPVAAGGAGRRGVLSAAAADAEDMALVALKQGSTMCLFYLSCCFASFWQ